MEHYLEIGKVRNMSVMQVLMTKNTKTARLQMISKFVFFFGREFYEFR